MNMMSHQMKLDDGGGTPATTTSDGNAVDPPSPDNQVGITQETNSGKIEQNSTPSPPSSPQDDGGDGKKRSLMASMDDEPNKKMLTRSSSKSAGAAAAGTDHKSFSSSSSSIDGGASKDGEESKDDNSKNNDNKANNHHNNIPLHPSKLGRKGDPRMHRAVAIRLANPDISLLDALRAGGFDFPEEKEVGALDGHVVDSDSITLCQRKNQLSRRLRLARTAIEKGQPVNLGDIDLEMYLGEMQQQEQQKRKQRGITGMIIGDIVTAHSKQRGGKSGHRRRSDSNAGAAAGGITGSSPSSKDGQTDPTTQQTVSVEAPAQIQMLMRNPFSSSQAAAQQQRLGTDKLQRGGGDATDNNNNNGVNDPSVLSTRLRGSPGKKKRSRSNESANSDRGGSSLRSIGGTAGRTFRRQASILSVDGDPAKEDLLEEDDDDMADDMATLTRRMAKNHPLYGNAWAFGAHPVNAPCWNNPPSSVSSGGGGVGAGCGGGNQAAYTATAHQLALQQQQQKFQQALQGLNQQTAMTANQQQQQQQQFQAAAAAAAYGASFAGMATMGGGGAGTTQAAATNNSGGSNNNMFASMMGTMGSSMAASSWPNTTPSSSMAAGFMTTNTGNAQQFMQQQFAASAGLSGVNVGQGFPSQWPSGGVGGGGSTMQQQQQQQQQPMDKRERSGGGGDESSSSGQMNSGPEAALATSMGMTREQMMPAMSKGGFSKVFGSDSTTVQQVRPATESLTNNNEANNRRGVSAQRDDASATNSTDGGLTSEVLESKMRIALDLYQAEATATLRRCMLMAGFDANKTAETDDMYVDFAERALNAERQRLDRLRYMIQMRRSSQVGAGSSSNVVSLDSEHDTASNTPQSDQMRYQGQNNAEDETSSRSSSRQGPQDTRSGDTTHEQHEHGRARHDHGHRHRHHHSHSQDHRREVNPGGIGGGGGGACFDGKHVHRLEGKCGHKAIIHQPENGPAHVDFMVNGKVECYQGIKPVTGSKAALWPSRYNCDQLSCRPDPSHKHEVTCGDQECVDECSNAKNSEPKVLDLSNIDLEGKEWNSDFFNMPNGQGDDTLLGLIRLGDLPD